MVLPRFETSLPDGNSAPESEIIKDAILSSLFPENMDLNFTSENIQDSNLPSEPQGTSVFTSNSEKIMEYVYLPIIDEEDKEVSFNIKKQNPIFMAKKRDGSKIDMVR